MARDVAAAISQAILEARVRYCVSHGHGSLTDVVQVRVGCNLYLQLRAATVEQLGPGWEHNKAGEPWALGVAVIASPAVEPWGWQVWSCVTSGRAQPLRAPVP